MHPESSIGEELCIVATELPEPMKGQATKVVETLFKPDLHVGYLLGRIADFHSLIERLYDDIGYEENPTREAWEFGLLLHQGLCEDTRQQLDVCRDRVRAFLLRSLGSWTKKSDWERDVEQMLREQHEGALTA